MVDTVHGKLRVRAWPKPRGPERSPVNRDWSAWLRAATYLYRYQPADVQAQFTAATKGTVWMPRDIFISAMRARAFQLQDQFGRKYYPMAMREDVSESLDAIAQVEDRLMVRGPTLWLPLTLDLNTLQVDKTTPDAPILGVRFSGARLAISGAITTTTGVLKVLNYDVEDYDTDDYHDLGANTNRLVAPIDGLYLVGLNIEWSANATGYRAAFIRNSSGNNIGRSSMSAAPTGNSAQNVVITAEMSAGDWVESCAQQSSGGNRNIEANYNSAKFWIQYLTTL